jgi:hypothetical protein
VFFANQIERSALYGNLSRRAHRWWGSLPAAIAYLTYTSFLFGLYFAAQHVQVATASQ